VSCDKKTKVEKAVEQIPMQVDVDRFDKAFFQTKPEDLANSRRNIRSFSQPETMTRFGLKKCKIHNGANCTMK
jgi:hypothetical protein